MTDVSIHYYDATEEEWIDLTNYATGFKVEDQGIIKVPSATINFETARSNLDDYLYNPYRLIRIRANPGSWQNLFYGYIDECYIKTLPGTITERLVMSLDCLSFAARLAQDYITLDYYALQSALTPYTGADSWTFRDMIEDFLETPDSRYPTTGYDYGTGFEVEAAVDALGIDHLIDGTGTWDNQSLFEAIRLTAEHIGYDGYYYLANESVAPKIRLYPFNKASIYTLTNPFIKEPEWRSGSLADIGNMIFVEGGVDVGIPSDGDRWTEYGYTKYDPTAWSAIATIGTPTLSDATNTNFTYSGVLYGAGSKSVKIAVSSGSNGGWATSCLDISATDETSIDCLNRCTALNVAVYPSVGSGKALLIIKLEDTNGDQIEYACIRTDVQSNYASYDSNKPTVLSLTVGDAIRTTYPLPFFYSMADMMNDTEAQAVGNKWYYVSGSTTFDWKHVKCVYVSVGSFQSGAQTTWNFEVDAIQFYGGIKIDQFSALNPPAVDFLSISGDETHPGYGVHPFKHNDAQISSFEQAQAEAARILNNMRNPIPTLKCTKLLPTTQLYPSNVVTVATVDYRIANIIYEWHAKSKWVEATYSMVTKTSPLPQIWTQDNELRYLVK